MVDNMSILLYGDVFLAQEAVAIAAGDATYIGTEGMAGDGMAMGTETGVKDPIMSNWFFVGGISAFMLVISIVFGILLAKKRIKKGIELYED